MRSIFNPDSIAVVGASSDPDSISGQLMTYLLDHGYEGDVYPVNPNRSTVSGLQCYPGVSDLPETPDLMLILLPARLVVETLEEGLETGVENIIIVSSGFAETETAESEAAEQRIAELARKHDANVIGPNSQGIITVPEHVAASFTPALQRKPMNPGKVSFVTQSGGFAGAITTMLQDSDVGLNKWVATGNEADLESLDFLKHFATDETTGVAAGYVEGFEDGRKLIELKRTEEGINLPIVLVKVGQSDRAKAAAASHTGKVAGSQQVYEGVFAETGVMFVDDIHRFVNVTRTISMLETLPGDRLGVITTSGGAGVHIADIASQAGVGLPELSSRTGDGILEHIPEYGSALNPVDITAQVVRSPEVFKECIQLLLQDEDLDVVLLQVTNVDGKRAAEMAKQVIEAATTDETPLFVSWTGGVDKKEAHKLYREAGIPVFENPRDAVETIAVVSQFRDSKARLQETADLPARPPSPAADGPPILNENEAKELLGEYGIRVPDDRLVTTASEAREAAEELGFPVVAKLVSPDVQHRDRIGGILADLESASEVESAFEDIEAICDERDVLMDGVSVQKQVAPGLELSLGIHIDDDFGPVVMFGRGGVDMESLEDITFRTIPTGRLQASAMINELETVDEASLGADERDGLVDAVVGLSDLYCDNPWIREADVNPIIVGPDGIHAVDALFIGPD